jgi:hypothetical protein
MPGSVCADPRGARQDDNGEALCRPSTSYRLRTPVLASAGTHLSCSEQSPAASHWDGARIYSTVQYRCWALGAGVRESLAVTRTGAQKALAAAMEGNLGQQKAVSMGAPPPPNLMAKAKDAAPPHSSPIPFIRSTACQSARRVLRVRLSPAHLRWRAIDSMGSDGSAHAAADVDGLPGRNAETALMASRVAGIIRSKTDDRHRRFAHSLACLDGAKLFGKPCEKRRTLTGLASFGEGPAPLALLSNLHLGLMSPCPSRYFGPSFPITCLIDGGVPVLWE